MSNQRKPQPEKISADCPHCGFSQLESAYAKSTICRRCSQPYSIEKLLAKEVSSLKAPSLFDKLSKLVSRETIREVSCFSCQATQEVSSSAESTLCPKCGSYIDLRDFKITGPFGRSIQTQGEVIISSKGDATSQRILCGSARIEGKVRGHIICTGTVLLKSGAKISGSIEAKELVIERKAEVEIARPVKAESFDINGKVSVDLYCPGKVVINKHGGVMGDIYARSIVIEKGGMFSGNLHIGEGTVEPQAQAAAPEAQAEEEQVAEMPAEYEEPGDHVAAADHGDLPPEPPTTSESQSASGEKSKSILPPKPGQHLGPRQATGAMARLRRSARG